MRNNHKDIKESVNYSVAGIEEASEYRNGDWRTLPKGPYPKGFFLRIVEDFEENVLPELNDIFYDFSLKKYQHQDNCKFDLRNNDPSERFHYYNTRSDMGEVVCTNVVVTIKELTDGEVLIVFEITLTNKVSCHVVFESGKEPTTYNLWYKYDNFEFSEQLADMLNFIYGHEVTKPENYYMDKNLKESVNYSVAGIDTPIDNEEFIHQTVQDVINRVEDILPVTKCEECVDYGDTKFIPGCNIYLEDYTIRNNKLFYSFTVNRIRYYIDKGFEYKEAILYQNSIDGTLKYDCIKDVWTYSTLFNKTRRINHTFTKREDAEMMLDLTYAFNPTSRYTVDMFMSKSKKREELKESVNYSVSGITDTIDNEEFIHRTVQDIMNRAEDILPVTKCEECVNYHGSKTFVPGCYIYLDDYIIRNNKLFYSFTVNDIRYCIDKNLEYKAAVLSWNSSNNELKYDGIKDEWTYTTFYKTRKLNHTFTDTEDAEMLLDITYVLNPDTKYTLEKFMVKPERKSKLKESVNYSVSGLDTEQEDYYVPGCWRNLKFGEFTDDFLDNILEDMKENIIPEIQDIFSDFNSDYIDEFKEIDKFLKTYVFEWENTSKNKFIIYPEDKGEKPFKTYIRKLFLNVYALNTKSIAIEFGFYLASLKKCYVYLRYNYLEQVINIAPYRLKDKVIAQQIADACNVFLGYKRLAPEDFLVQKSVKESVDYSVAGIDDSLSKEYRSGDWRHLQGNEYDFSHKDDILNDIELNAIPELQDICFDFESEKGIIIKDKEISICLTNNDRMKVPIIYNNGHYVYSDAIFESVTFSSQLLRFGCITTMKIAFRISKTRIEYIIFQNTWGEVRANTRIQKIGDYNVSEQIADLYNFFYGQDLYSVQDFYYEDKETIDESIDYSVNMPGETQIEYIDSMDFLKIKLGEKVPQKYIDDMIFDIQENFMPEVLDICDFSNLHIVNGNNGIAYYFTASDNVDATEEKRALTAVEVQVDLFKKGFFTIEIHMILNGFRDRCILKFTNNPDFTTNSLETYSNEIYVPGKPEETKEICEMASEIVYKFTKGNLSLSPDYFIRKLTESISYSVNNQEEAEYRTNDFFYVDHPVDETFMQKAKEDIEDNVISNIKEILGYEKEVNKDFLNRMVREITTDGDKIKWKTYKETTEYLDRVLISFYETKGRINFEVSAHIKKIDDADNSLLSFYFINFITYTVLSDNKIFKERSFSTFKHQISSIEVCDQLAEIMNMFWPYDPISLDIFYKEPIEFNESVNYSISSINDYVEDNNIINILKANPGAVLSDEKWESVEDYLKSNILERLHDDIWFDYELVTDRYLSKHWEVIGYVYLHNSSPIFLCNKRNSKLYLGDFNVQIKRDKNHRVYCFSIYMDITNQARKDISAITFIKFSDDGELVYEIPDELYHTIEDWELCERLADTFKLIWNDNIDIEPYYFYKEKLTESVDYSVANIDDEINVDFMSFMRSYTGQNITPELFGRYENFITEFLVPDIQDIWPEWEVKSRPQKSNQLDIKGTVILLKDIDKNEPAYHNEILGQYLIRYEFENIVTEFTMIDNQRIFDYSVSLYIKTHKEFRSFYISGDFVKYDDNRVSYNMKALKHRFSDWDLCERISDTFHIFWPDDTEHTPKYFFRKSKLKESVNYSVANIDNEEEILDNYSQNCFYSASGYKVTENFLAGFKEDIINNIIPRIEDIIPDMEFYESNIQNDIFEISLEAPSGVYSSKSGDDFKYVLKDITFVGEIYEGYFLARFIMWFDKQVRKGKKYKSAYIEAGNLLSVSRHSVSQNANILHHQFDDYEFCQMISELFAIFNNDNSQFSPEFFYRNN